jgi:hypothetical protein
MIDEYHFYRKNEQPYAAYSWVKHCMDEFARGDVHNNTAESFSTILERAISISHTI